MIHLKKYHPKRGLRRSEVFLTFSKLRISFSTPCIVYLQRKPYAEFFFSEDKETISIRPTQLETVDTVKISMNENTKANPSMGCRGFIRDMGILKFLEKENRYSVQIPAIWDDKQKAFLLKMDFLK